MTKLARTTDEMRFAATLEPCAACGTRELGALELSGDGYRWRLTGACPICGTSRDFEFTTTGDPRIARASRFELGDGLSTLITAEQFLGVLDQASPNVPDDPTPLSTEKRRAALRELNRAFTSVNELLKLVPPGDARMPGTSDVRLARPWLEREYIRLRKLVSRYRPQSTISQDQLDAHLAYLRRGATGPGYLSIQGKRMADEFYGPVDLTAVSIVSSDLTNVDLGYATFDEGNFEDVTFTGAILDGASITNARIKGGTWTRVRLSIAKLNAAEVSETDFSQADLERSHWIDAKVVGATFDGARFGNSVFDRARFERCSFRQATFDRTMPEPQPTSAGAQFVDCDFSGVSFLDRDLRNTTFVRCKLASSTGAKPADGLVLTECDVDLKRFVSSTN